MRPTQLARRMKKRKNPEEQIQCAVVDHLRYRAYPDVVWFHVPNGGKRNIATAARLKRMGVRAGVSDILAFRCGEMFALELKAPKGRPTETQLEFLSNWREAGGHGVVAEGVGEAIAVLESWNLIRPEVAGRVA